ncbi:MAG: MgtC/SapB family protein [Planctomycetota bacterium]
MLAETPGGAAASEFISLGIALGVGLLVGFERERQPDTVAGVRTFGLAGLAGGLAALLSSAGTTPWVLLAVAVVAGVGGVAGGIATVGRAAPRADDPHRDSLRDVGLTTAFALVCTALLGGYAVMGDRATAVVAAGVLFLLLYIRDPLHAMIRRLGQEDVRAIATFVLIALVILPVLPDRAIDPLGAVNPRAAWLLVVLVVSLSLAGYVAQALLGPRAGLLATGLLGGLVSSTATTVGAARRAREDGAISAAAAVSLLACAVLPVRLVVLVGIASPAAVAKLWPWLAAVACATVAGGLVSLRGALRAHSGVDALPKPKNPTQLTSAIAFAAVYVLIRFVTKASLVWVGAGAFFAVAALSGVTDMDAIAMSAAREVVDGTLDAGMAARATLLALAVNTVFKLFVAGSLGTRALFMRVLPTLSMAAAIAAAGVAFA